MICAICAQLAELGRLQYLYRDGIENVTTDDLLRIENGDDDNRPPPGRLAPGVRYRSVANGETVGVRPITIINGTLVCASHNKGIPR